MFRRAFLSLRAPSLSSRRIKTALAAAVMAGAGLVYAAGPVQAGPATQVEMFEVDTSMSVGYPDPISVHVRDAGNAPASNYTGTITFSATGSDPACVDCFTVTPNNGAGADAFKYTYTPGDASVKQFTVTWLTEGENKELKVTAVLPDGDDEGTDPDSDTDTESVDVLAQKATQGGFDSTGAGAVDDTPTIGVDDQVTVSFRNALGDIDTGYTGTLNWDDSTCDGDFLVNNAVPAPYTFVPGDAGAKTFNVKWLDTAQTPAGCTLAMEATLAGTEDTVTDSVSGIEPSEPEPTTTTTGAPTTTSSTTSTTIPQNLPHIQGALVAGALAPGGPHVKVFKASDRSLQREFFAYGLGFRGGVNVALGDVNEDGWSDIVTGAGPGGGSHVKVFSGKSGLEIASFFAFPVGFNGGVNVAAGDVNNDGNADIIVAPAGNGGPHVKVFSGTAAIAEGYAGADSGLLASFYAYSTNPVFLGGVRLGAVDADDDGKAEIVTGAGPGGGPHVAIYKPGANLGTRTVVGEWFAYGTNFTNGIFVGASKQGGTPHIITGAGPGGGQHVRVWTVDGTEIAGVIPQVGTVGATVALGNADADGAVEYAVGNASGSSGVRIFELVATESGTQTTAFAGHGGGISIALGDI